MRWRTRTSAVGTAPADPSTVVPPPFDPDPALIDHLEGNRWAIRRYRRHAELQQLAALLAPYPDPDPTQAGRLLDVPPAVAAAALALLPPDLAAARLNLSGPSSAALVAVADALGGRLVGSLAPGRCFLRIDGVQLEVQPGGAAAAGRALAERIVAAAPTAERVPGEAPGEASDVLAAAVAEAWPSWTATAAIWTGTGADLRTAALPPEARVLGVWFD